MVGCGLIAAPSQVTVASRILETVLDEIFQIHIIFFKADFLLSTLPISNRLLILTFPRLKLTTSSWYRGHSHFIRISKYHICNSNFLFLPYLTGNPFFINNILFICKIESLSCGLLQANGQKSYMLCLHKYLRKWTNWRSYSKYELLPGKNN